MNGNVPGSGTAEAGVMTGWVTVCCCVYRSQKVPEYKLLHFKAASILSRCTSAFSPTTEPITVIQARCDDHGEILALVKSSAAFSRMLLPPCLLRRLAEAITIPRLGIAWA